MKGDKGTALMGSGKGIAGIDQQVVWRPMPRKGSDWSFLVGAYSYLLAVAAILGRQHQLFLNAIVVALRPAKIGAFFQLHYFLGGELCALIGGEEISASPARAGRGHA